MEKLKDTFKKNGLEYRLLDRTDRARKYMSELDSKIASTLTIRGINSPEVRVSTT